MRATINRGKPKIHLIKTFSPPNIREIDLLLLILYLGSLRKIQVPGLTNNWSRKED